MRVGCPLAPEPCCVGPAPWHRQDQLPVGAYLIGRWCLGFCVVGDGFGLLSAIIGTLIVLAVAGWLLRRTQRGSA
jgi:hypothetical protein